MHTYVYVHARAHAHTHGNSRTRMRAQLPAHYAQAHANMRIHANERSCIPCACEKKGKGRKNENDILGQREEKKAKGRKKENDILGFELAGYNSNWKKLNLYDFNPKLECRASPPHPPPHTHTRKYRPTGDCNSREGARGNLCLPPTPWEDIPLGQGRKL